MSRPRNEFGKSVIIVMGSPVEGDYSERYRHN